ncbi:MAG: class I SAM-dependent methyltransferase, partial [Rhodospirillales bacterium]|nr:class I SAM-dependent methyltransferase [Rhodospirillales bacterium]
YIERGARRSAAVMVPLLRGQLAVRSVLDVGCGHGVWLAAWSEAGLAEIFGVDGEYVDPATLLVPPAAFLAADLAQGFRLGRCFDLVQCLEVAEHLPCEAADRLVESLVAHGDLILFSAATPGQGGEHHVNEQPLDYWRNKFLNHFYLGFDCVRPALRDDRRVEPWYRYNTILYASPAIRRQLPESVRATALAPDRDIPELAPLSWRLRRRVLKHLPAPVSETLARMRHRLVLGLRP